MQGHFSILSQPLVTENVPDPVGSGACQPGRRENDRGIYLGVALQIREEALHEALGSIVQVLSVYTVSAGMGPYDCKDLIALRVVGQARMCPGCFGSLR